MRTKDFIKFIIPSMFVIILVSLVPSIVTFFRSFTQETLISKEMVFVGLSNYKSILGDMRFWNATANTLLFTSIVIPVGLVIGFICALMLDKITHLRSLYTGTLLMPFVIVPVVAALAFGWVFRGSFGIINYLISTLGLTPPDWFSNPFAARILIIIFEIWKNMPFALIILFAGLQTLPMQVDEAADIDGANYLQKIFYIKIPLLRQHIYFILAITLVNCFQTFDSVYVLTGGGPGLSTELLALYNYKMAFNLFDVGKSSAIAILTIIMMAFILCFFIYSIYKQYRSSLEIRKK
jgi:multiple sugar transport system permease protein